MNIRTYNALLLLVFQRLNMKTVMYGDCFPCTAALKFELVMLV